VAIASRYGELTSEQVRRAQKQLSEKYADIIEGPDTDRIDDKEDRTSDGQRFSGIGLQKHAAAWFRVIKREHGLLKIV
jgi:hypothetical protein